VARVVRSGPSQAQVVVTLSENLQGLLWVAEIHRGGPAPQEIPPDVVMIQVARPATETLPAPGATLALRKTLVYEQSEPILDLAVTEPPGAAGPRLLVLDPERVATYRKQGDEWVIAQSLPIPRSRPWPRDPRGRLAVRQDGRFDAFTPGTECQGEMLPSLTLECRASDDAWPISLAGPAEMSAHFVTDRNYFDGKLTLAGKELRVPMFFTAAAIPSAGRPLIVLAGLDGRTRIFGGKPEPIGALDGWGSDLAAIQSGCGSGWQILSTRSGDLTQPDSVRAFSLRDGTAAEASAPVEFPGPITALWPDESGRTARAVARDPRTGEYEAFTLSISCGG
jgi:hypothetical protein